MDTIFQRQNCDHLWKWKVKGKHRYCAKCNLNQEGFTIGAKNDIMIPSRVAIALQNDGWILRNSIIWNKLNHMPSSVKDRFACGYEFVFFFVKQQKYYFDLDAVREPHTAVSLDRAKYEFNAVPRAWEKGLTPVSGGINPNIAPHHSGKNPGDVVLDNWGTDKNQEYHGNGKHNPKGQSPSDLKKNIIESYKKNPKGKNPGDVLPLRHHGSCLSNVVTYYGDQIPNFCHPNGANPGDFWSLTTQPFIGYSEEFEHFACFPESLVVRPLKASCPKNGVVLDPFCGRGTVGKVAKRLGFHYIMIDIKPEYCELARLYIAGQKHRLHKNQKKLITR